MLRYANILAMFVFLSPLSIIQIKTLMNVSLMIPSVNKCVLTPMEDTCALVRMAISM